MKVLVFGKNGQVGQTLSCLDDVVAAGREEADLSKPEEIRRQIESVAPTAIINAAAYTAVDKAEEETDLAMAVNGVAPGVMAETAAEAGIPLVHVSTDCVFDGKLDRPYVETDAPNPINVYGQTKLAGEEAVLKASDRHIVLRVSWVFSEVGSNFLHSMLRLSETRDELSIVSDQIGGPTSASDIAKVLWHLATEAAKTGETPRGVFHLASQPFVSRADFAREIFRQTGRDVIVNEIPTSAFPTPARRPLNSRLDGSHLSQSWNMTAPDWRESLRDVLGKLKIGKANGEA